MSSFVKKTGTSKPKQPPLPAGCKPSIYNNQTVMSSGVAAIDFLLGGGLPLGSLVLIEEDELRTYSDLLLRYFLSEGILCGHKTVISVSLCSFEEFMKQLPGVSEPLVGVEQQDCTGEDSGVGESMKIAFRYETLHQVDSEFKTAVKFCHSYDLTHKLDFNTFVKDNADITAINNELYSADKAIDMRYSQLLESIRGDLTACKGGAARVALQHVGSALWCDSGPEGSKQFIQFLFNLRVLTRSHPVTCLLSYPTYNHSELDRNRIRHLSDVVYGLECFQSTDKDVSPLFSDYHGLFHLVKLPKINSLQSFVPETLNFGFKAKKRKFVIEKLHLPPELGGDEKQENSVEIKNVKIDKKNLEF